MHVNLLRGNCVVWINIMNNIKPFLLALEHNSRGASIDAKQILKRDGFKKIDYILKVFRDF